MTPTPRSTRRLFQLACLVLILLASATLAPPRTASACLPFGTYVYRNCQGQILATCKVQTNCVSCCSGPTTGWCTRTFTAGSPTCIPIDQ